jgi:polysaccharide biosynthesis/export protein
MEMIRLLTACLASGLCLAQEAPPVTTPEPTNSSLPANLPAQPLGPNDLLMISVYDAPELSRSVRVGADGTIRLPMLKEHIRAEGLMPAGLERAIRRALVDEGILVDPIVTVTIAEYYSRPISVAGAVRNPLTFQADGAVTLLQAIARAGGLDRTAGATILFTRDGDTFRVPVKELIDQADPRWNVVLHGGEEIRVPEAGRIFVVGNVNKPGAFSTSDLTDATVLKAIAVAEGLKPFSAKEAYIYRPEANGKKREIAVNLRRILDRKSPDVTLEARDVLYIPDNRHTRIGAAALDRILGFGTTAGATALIYH